MKAIALIAAGLLAGTVAANAEDTPTVIVSPTVAYVHYQPSDLTTAQGVRDLRRRVNQTADRLCRPSEDTFLGTFNQLTCLSPTLRDALSQIDSAVARTRSGALASADRITIRVR